MNIEILKKNIVDTEFKNSILYYETIDSTNTYLKNNFETLNNKSIVIAKTQTLGRGKNNRTWFSPVGGIYMSILLKELKNIKNIEILPLITSLAIAKALKSLNISAMIKWPNDIIVNNKKMGGILVESKVIKGNLKCLVIGIGLNITSSLPDQEIKNKFIALHQINDSLPKSELIIANIVNELNLLLNLNSNNILEEYKKLSILQDKIVNLISSDSTMTNVKVLDINSDGSLKVQNLNTKNELNIVSGEFSITGLKDYI